MYKIPPEADRKILICGNGPSAAEIDFRRVPKDCKVMRMTNFFFEEKYYAGKQVDYYIEYVKRLENQYFNIRHLNERGEYNINMQNIYITVTDANEHYPTMIPATPLIQQNKRIAEFRCFYQYYYGQYLSTGTTAIALAAVLGFNEIYLAGFDMYSNGIHLYRDGENFQTQYYKDNSPTEDIYQTKINNTMEDVMKNHPTEIQIKFFELLKTEFANAVFYSVSESSPINKYFELGPLLYDNDWYIPEVKAANAIRDWLPLPETMPKRENRT